MAAIDDLTAQVTATDSVEDSALALINGFAARLAAAGVDPAALAQLQSDLKTHADALSAAVMANTPAPSPGAAAAAVAKAASTAAAAKSAAPVLAKKA